MPRIQLAEQASALTRTFSNQPYICRVCLAQTSRRFSAARPQCLDFSFHKRIRESLFGSKESKQAEEAQEMARKRRIDALSNRDTKAPLERKTDRWGHDYEVAELVDPTTHKDYVVSNTWHGLEIVGSEQWVKARADQGEVYTGYTPLKAVQLNDEQWKRLLHHATVELLALQKAGRNVLEICHPRSSATDSTMRHTVAATFGLDYRTLQFSSPDVEAQVLASILPSADVDASSEGSSARSIAHERKVVSKHKGAALPHENNAWMDLPIRDPNVKFALLKRTVQLTGRRVSDYVINDCNTVADLWNALKTKEKAKKLFDTPQIQHVKLEVPNVAIHGSRRTPIHKEKEIGRWKLIEDELIMRDLPVTGSRLPGAKEGLRNNGL